MKQYMRSETMYTQTRMKQYMRSDSVYTRSRMKQLPKVVICVCFPRRIYSRVHDRRNDDGDVDHLLLMNRHKTVLLEITVILMMIMMMILTLMVITTVRTASIK